MLNFNSIPSYYCRLNFGNTAILEWRFYQFYLPRFRHLACNKVVLWIRILAVMVLFMLQACSTNPYSIRSYKETTNEIQKKYNLKRADLIVTYDLARINNSTTIYAQDLGLVANEKDYAKKYLNKFHSKYKSEKTLKQEAKKKIRRISKFLFHLQEKYHFLNSKKENYIKSLAHADLNKRDIRTELSNLDKMTSYIPLMLPVYNGQMTSCYGNRKHPTKKKVIFHCGTDFVGRKSAPIYASAHGKVIFAGMQNGYGLSVEIDHGNALKTKYTHLSRLFVRKGHKVIRGEVLGIQGKTGNSTGEHLHFEVHLAGRHINPYDFVGHNYGLGD